VIVIQEIAQGFTLERHYVRLRLIVTAGAVESAEAVGRNEADLAVVRADLDLPKDALSVAVFRKNVVALWVANTAGPKGQKMEIKKITDLSGRRVAIVGKMQANVDLLKINLAESGVSSEKVEFLQVGTTEIGDALRNEKVDALMAVGPVDSKITADAIAITTRAGSTPSFLAIDAAEIIARKHSAYESTEIAAGALGANPARPDDDVTTLGVNHLIIARKALSELTVTAFTKQLFAIRHSLQKDFPGVANIQVPDTDKAAVIPAHPGAAAYIDGTERTFLERYSDFMWLGLMVLSVLASGGAWFRSYMRRDERARNTTMRNRLVEMISLGRASRSIQQLDLLQKEADEILKDTLNCFDDGAVAQDTFSAFNLALDQFHSAVSDCKQWLADDRSNGDLEQSSQRRLT
jgi:TRAP transporter TAXI family solute receptor